MGASGPKVVDMKAIESKMADIKNKLAEAKGLAGTGKGLVYEYKNQSESRLAEQAKAFKDDAMSEIKALGLTNDADRIELEEKTRAISDSLNKALEKEYVRMSSAETKPGEEWQAARWNKIFSDAKDQLTAAVAALPPAEKTKTDGFVAKRNEKLDEIKDEGLQNETDNLVGSSKKWVERNKIVNIDLQVRKIFYPETYKTDTKDIFRAMGTKPVSAADDLDASGLAVLGSTDLDRDARAKLNALVESTEMFFQSDKYKGISYEIDKDGAVKITNGIKASWKLFGEDETKYVHAVRGQIECFMQKLGIKPGDSVVVSYKDPGIFKRADQLPRVLIMFEMLKEKGLNGKLDPAMRARLEVLKGEGTGVKTIDKIFKLESEMQDNLANAKLIGKNRDEMQTKVDEARDNLAKNGVAKAQLKAKVAEHKAAVAKHKTDTAAAVAASTPPPAPPGDLGASAVLSPTDHATKYLPLDEVGKLAIVKQELKALHERVEQSKRAQDIVDKQLEKMTAFLDKEASPEANAFGFDEKQAGFTEQVKELRSLQADNVIELEDLTNRSSAWEAEMKTLSTSALITGDTAQKKLFDDSALQLATDKTTIAATTTKAKDDAPCTKFEADLNAKAVEAKDAREAIRPK
ncbi:MAG: hypothetical protein ABI597_11680 [Gammaproteobacteria bacterium]